MAPFIIINKQLVDRWMDLEQFGNRRLHQE
jgi:hypothetical protein